jgi:anti-anti-sigma factor
MEIRVERDGDALVAITEGRVDGANAREFQDALQEAIDEKDRTVVLDLGGLTYISSAGLRVILLTARTLRGQDARLAVSALSEPIMEVFQLSGFDKIISIFPSTAEAISGAATQ